MPTSSSASEFWGPFLLSELLEEINREDWEKTKKEREDLPALTPVGEERKSMLWLRCISQSICSCRHCITFVHNLHLLRKLFTLKCFSGPIAPGVEKCLYVYNPLLTVNPRFY